MEGQPAKEILKLAEEESVDLIVKIKKENHQYDFANLNQNPDKESKEYV